VVQSDRPLLLRLRGGHLAQHLDRGPALPRRRGRGRPLGRRPPAG
jgi:hypothetical protein